MAKLALHQWFQKRKLEKEAGPASERLDIPGNLWIKCTKCQVAIFAKDLDANLKVCPKCGYHFKLSARERIEATIDPETFTEISPFLHSKDFLGFVDSAPYSQRILKSEEKTGLADAIVIGEGELHGIEVGIGVMDFSFMGGSMGSVVGEKVTRIAEICLDKKIPLIIFSSSGGARMQEGIMSLMQMAKTSAALSRLRSAAIPYLSIMTDPTTGGTTASFAMLGDLNIAEPGALIGFAGPRVIEQTIRQKLPPGFQRAEFLEKHGMVDIVSERGKMKEELKKVLHFFENAAKT
ncbi:acetyl-CoA carboxylase subunit beta [candidate division WOR-1 bacterium RIFOXYA12_FULL_43_27]|uniref:Acetyl-coenzyme A carboxylase carboxyl transferase subunit beta n=1 Tax=candidate division WOR-1 bacterium RIFOXYC2_FULL_46_14 TaxID=1802587 RepID=A0A1F4U7M4_UNCSA|nr:MAG: acetyl-CoA carboxylase subunit beta [candidate division WOR-1 bacterium RIFOXYA12_FULL_43_27]OGC19331.1 MAG: acetyl-CoA carboxylase subunit beta [candidate division WOR-1 bacterium RIFOXYB2_FULL_46_45]OGC30320.1 MAG: acetyl-CoA carboxylase subunit beta [candidate division WOR-1 bacterium RIFOXYA2_FULL_46_56]OGC40921.1 MAG: acetyl-CoA carboxylase subunit beta [candidate division WOR-1 bacterium RIFOXYC2_FULL_46_14]